LAVFLFTRMVLGWRKQGFHDCLAVEKAGKQDVQDEHGWGAAPSTLWPWFREGELE